MTQVSIRNLGELNIAELLKKERASRKISMQALSSYLGCSPSYICRLERGERKTPSYEMVFRIIEFFQLSENDLKQYRVGGEGTEVTKEEVLKFIDGMNIESFTDVTQLVLLIKKYKNKYK